MSSNSISGEKEDSKNSRCNGECTAIEEQQQPKEKKEEKKPDQF